jgi:hypothetical protein
MLARSNLPMVSSGIPALNRDMLTFEVGHVRPHIRVQRVDNHLAIGRAGNLNAPVDQAGRGWCALPCLVLADMLGLRQEVEQVALVELGLSDHASLEESLPALVECAVEQGEEDGSILAEDVTLVVLQLAEDVDLAEDGFGVGGHCEVCSGARSMVGMLTVQAVRNVMMYACGEGWADRRHYNPCRRHPSCEWAEDLLCLPAEVG